MSIVNTCAVSKRGRCSVQYTVLLLKSDMLADSIYSAPCGDGTTSSAVIRRVTAKLLNVAKRAHYDGQKQTKLMSFLSEINCSDYMYADICA